MKSQQKERLCVKCDKIFQGCQVFYGYVLIPDYCSKECYEADNPNFEQELYQ